MVGYEHLFFFLFSVSLFPRGHTHKAGTYARMHVRTYMQREGTPALMHTMLEASKQSKQAYGIFLLLIFSLLVFWWFFFSLSLSLRAVFLSFVDFRFEVY